MPKRAFILVAAFLMPLCGAAAQVPPFNSNCGVSGGTNSGTITQNCLAVPVVKSPYLAVLQSAYADGAVIVRQLRVEPITDDQIDALTVEANQWVNSTYAYLHNTVTPAAAEKFLRRGGNSYSWSLGGTHKDGEKEKRENAINALNELLDNLDALMRSQDMYPQ